MNPRPSTALATVPHESGLPAHAANVGDVLFDRETFAHLRDVAQVLADSQMIPSHFRGKWQDVLLGCALAKTLGENPLILLQGLHVIQGRVGFSAQFMIARVNASGKLRGPIRYRETGEGDSLAVTAYATLADSGDSVEITVSVAMAKAEGWFAKNPKWRNLPQLMCRYRSASFLIRTHFPEVLLGYHEVHELIDSAKHPVEVDYTDPFPSSSAPARRPISVAPAPLGGVSPVAEDDLPSVAPIPGEDPDIRVGADSSILSSAAHPLPSPQHVAPPVARDPAVDGTSPSSASSQAVSPPMETQPAAQGADLGDERAKVLAEVAELREECSVLLREEAQALGLKSPRKAPTLRLRELVTATRGRRPLMALTDEVLLERWHAAVDAVGDADYACVIAQRYGLPIVDERAVTDGAPRAWIERCLVTLLLVAEQRQQERQDEAVRATLLEQAREVLAGMVAEAAEEALVALGVRTLEEATEEQLRQIVVLGRGAQGGGA